MSITLVVVIIVLALVFDFINGFHDAANSIATVVSTKVLTPFQAVVWAAFFNFIAFFIFSDHAVANTVAKTVKEDWITLPVILSGLLAAIFWNLLTWWYGIPSSSSHTLIGGFSGAAIAHAYYTGGFGIGMGSIIDSEKIVKTVIFIFLAPLIGMLVSMFITLVTIKRNLWYRLGIIAISLVATVYIFDYFENEKMQKEVESFVGIKDIKKELEASPDDATLKFKLEKATENAALLNPLVANYDQWGATRIANEAIAKNLLPIKEGETAAEIATKFSKKLEDKDNSIIVYCILLAGFIFIASYIYVEKIKKPTAARLANMFKKLQLLSSAAFSVGHGGNDAQKVMGIIAITLVAGGQLDDIKHMPSWIPIACYTAIGLGTLSGGWKIVKTMGTKITKVTPLEGVSAETAGALTLFVTEQMGIPVSTTHTITGSIIGVGATKRVSAVRWGVTRSLLMAWIITIPISAILAGIFYFTIGLLVSK